MRRLPIASVFCALLAFTVTAFAARVGDPAPDFTGTDSHGQSHKLSEYRGKYVVLEWTNSNCPFTRKHYASGNMQSLQRQWTARGVVWLTVLSSAPGNDGFKTAPEENACLQQVHAAPSAVILDPSGAIGHEYDAKTTPDMYVVDPSGKLIYSGAIDDRHTTDIADVQGAKNYVSAALNQSMAGQPVAISYTRSYGCSVKYSGVD
jgi:hypothetical protein